CFNIYFFFQAEDGIRDFHVTGVQTCALPIYASLAQADIQSTAVDVIFPGGPALAEEDVAEEVAIKSMFDQPLPIVIPKTVLGHRSEERRVGKECRVGGW